jgi:dienelactone hydrolase
MRLLPFIAVWVCRSSLVWICALWLAMGSSMPVLVQSASEESGRSFLEFVKVQAGALRAADEAPLTEAGWKQQADRLRADLREAMGGFRFEDCPLEPRKVGELQRDGYRVEKILLQTLPGIWMTANAYVPFKQGRLPAVLCVHGHWPGAKQDPTVQARCIGLAKLGFFVLSVDAFGAGERAVGKALGEYHGEMTAATLLPVGLPLSGLQVYENMRAVDYLRSRPEVDPERIGVTGASGGGNQTMYLAACDERLAAAAPVCSVGNYQAYLGAACCLCEVVPGVLQFTEEGNVLGLVAPRPLLVINATQDALQFSVGEARKSLARANRIFSLLGNLDRLRHATFESAHDYNQAMRETVYGWMARHLADTGDGRPIPEPQIKTEDPEALRCFPGDTRPDDFVTLPRFAAAEARKQLGRKRAPARLADWQTERRRMGERLETAVLGGMPSSSPLDLHIEAAPDRKSRVLRFNSEPGITLIARQEIGLARPAKVALLLDLEGAEKAAVSPLASALRTAGWSVVTPELRATGRFAVKQDRVGSAPDHNSAEWSLWLGRPLLGQWVLDVRRTLDALASEGGLPVSDITLVGFGPAGLVALCAAALDERFTRVVTVDSLVSYVSQEPYRNQRLGIMAPGILTEVGDIHHLAALVAPRPLVVAGGVNGGGEQLDPEAMRREYSFTEQLYRLHGASGAFRLTTALSAAELADTLVRNDSRVAYLNPLLDSGTAIQ